MSTRSTSAALCALAMGAGALAAQQAEERSAGVNRFPSNTIVARYDIDPQALSQVTSSVELVAALRDHLRVEAAMPLPEELRVHFGGTVSDARSGGDFPFLTSGLAIDLAAETTTSGDFASLVRDSRTPTSIFDDEWDEEEAWSWFVEAIETGLTRSLASDGSFDLGEDGHVPLEVGAVHVVRGDEEISDGRVERMYLRLQPRPGFASSALAEWEPPEDLAYDVQILLIELRSPTATAADAAPTPEPIDLPAEVLERLVGDYGVEGEFTLLVRLDGDRLMIADDAGEGEGELFAMSETQFWVDIEGRVDITFNLGDDGRATSLTMTQEGYTFEVPRLR